MTIQDAAEYVADILQDEFGMDIMDEKMVNAYEVHVVARGRADSRAVNELTEFLQYDFPDAEIMFQVYTTDEGLTVECYA